MNKAQLDEISTTIKIDSESIIKILNAFKEYIKKNKIKDPKNYLKSKGNRFQGLKNKILNCITFKVIQPIRLLKKLTNFDTIIAYLEDKKLYENEIYEENTQNDIGLNRFWNKTDERILCENIIKISKINKLYTVGDFVKRYTEDYFFKTSNIYYNLITKNIVSKNKLQIIKKVYLIVQKLQTLESINEIDIKNIYNIYRPETIRDIHSDIDMLQNSQESLDTDKKVNIFQIKETSGNWTTTECKKLRKAIRNLTKTPKNTYCDEIIPWTVVSKFVGTKNKYKCIDHWFSTFCWMKHKKSIVALDKTKFMSFVSQFIKDFEDNDGKINWKHLWLNYDNGKHTPSPRKFSKWFCKLYFKYFKLVTKFFDTYKEMLKPIKYYINTEFAESEDDDR